MENKKRGQMKTILALILLLIVSILIVSALTNSPDSFVIKFNDSLNITIGATISNQEAISQEVATKNYSEIRNLAKVFNEDNLDFDREYRINYLNEHSNFSNLNFKRVVDKEVEIFTVGARNDNTKGFNINNKNFAIDLIDCDSWERYCAFRINGVPTKKVFPTAELNNNRKNTFDLDEEYMLKVNSVQFDFCDNRRFCHLGYEGYHVVDVSIERKE